MLGLSAVPQKSGLNSWDIGSYRLTGERTRALSRMRCTEVASASISTDLGCVQTLLVLLFSWCLRVLSLRAWSAQLEKRWRQGSG